MTELLVIADDFTGALDTGIQFAREGTKTCVAIGACAPLSARASFPVVVIDSETRHLPHRSAYDAVYKITSAARAAGVKYIYKKTDSALRGCIGAELTAALDASGADELVFAPAFPKVRRTTEKGTQYINGVPVSESAFGRDPFEPVRHSYIPDIIAEQSDVTVRLESEAAAPGEKRITVCDAATDGDLAAVARRLGENGGTLAAGCAGLAAHLNSFIRLPKGETLKPRKTNGIFVVCGSLNPISEEQLDYAEMNGFTRISLTAEQKLLDGYLSTTDGKQWLARLKELSLSGQRIIIDTVGTWKECLEYASDLGIKNTDVRLKVAYRLGEIMEAWLGFNVNQTLVTIGGDTLASFMRQVGCDELTPMCELSDGVVCSLLKNKGREVQIVSKSGGLGRKTVLRDIFSQVLSKGGIR